MGADDRVDAMKPDRPEEYVIFVAYFAHRFIMSLKVL